MSSSGAPPGQSASARSSSRRAMRARAVASRSSREMPREAQAEIRAAASLAASGLPAACRTRTARSGRPKSGSRSVVRAREARPLRRGSLPRPPRRARPAPPRGRRHCRGRAQRSRTALPRRPRPRAGPRRRAARTPARARRSAGARPRPDTHTPLPASDTRTPSSTRSSDRLLRGLHRDACSRGRLGDPEPRGEKSSGLENGTGPPRGRGPRARGCDASLFWIEPRCEIPRDIEHAFRIGRPRRFSCRLFSLAPGRHGIVHGRERKPEERRRVPGAQAEGKERRVLPGLEASGSRGEEPEAEAGEVLLERAARPPVPPFERDRHEGERRALGRARGP